MTRWLDGEVASVDTLAESTPTAARLAEFLTALQHFEPETARAVGARDDLTAEPLAARDRATRAAIARTADTFDAEAMTDLWHAARNAPPWDRAAVWNHGVVAVITDLGTWVAPANRAIWIPAGTVHAHRAHGSLELCLVGLPVADNPLGLDAPSVLTVGPLLRELVLACSGAPDDGRPERRRLRAVLLDQLAASPQQPVHLPAPTDARLRRVCDILCADPADQRTLDALGRDTGASARTLSRLFTSDLGMTFPPVAHSTAPVQGPGPAGRGHPGNRGGAPVRLVVRQRVHRCLPSCLRSHSGHLPAPMSRESSAWDGTVNVSAPSRPITARFSRRVRR